LKILIKLFLIFISTISLYGSLVSTAFVNNDIRIIEELDIKSTFITDYNLQKELQKRLTTNKTKYAEKLNNAHLFIPQIKKILRENNIPSAFLYLVMAESEFIIDASSVKKAKGLWQFMPRTAEHFGLETNRYIDERMDIVKSTQAAVTYLKRLHDMFGKWYLAAVAYNCGEGRVIEGLTRAKIDMYCEDVGYKQCRKDPKIRKYRKIISDYQHKRVSFRPLGKVYNDVKNWDYNPDIDQLLLIQNNIDRQYIPNESRRYIRKIVALALMNNSDFLLQDQNTHLLNRGVADPIATIDVKGGVLLRDVAKIIGLEKDKLKELNQHIKKNILPLDKESYQIYIPYSKLSVYNSNKQNLKQAQYEIYKVKSGDSLASIGRKYDVDYKYIMKHNNLKSHLINIDQEIIIPVDPQIFKRDLDYTVKIGDTLSKIATQHNVNLDKLMNDNNLKTSMIKIGDRLVIKFK